MRFSVIIPVYNAVRYLEEALSSLRRQGFADWEAVCVDDGSSDGSGRMLDEHAARDSRIKVIHQPNRGTLIARKVAVAASEGEWCLFLDPDDWLSENALETLSPLLHGESVDIVMCGFDIRADDANARRVPALVRQFNPGTLLIDQAEAFRRCFISEDISAHLIGKVVRGDICRNVFGRQPDLDVIFQEDIYAMYLVLAECKALQSISNRLYNYRLGDGISYRKEWTLPEFKRTFNRLKLLGELRMFAESRFAAGTPARCAVDKIEIRMVRALISEAIERVYPVEDRKEAVALTMAACSRRVLGAALADWYSLKCEQFLSVADALGVSDFVGEMALRQLDFVWRGHNQRLRDHDRQLAELKEEMKALKKEVANNEKSDNLRNI